MIKDPCNMEESVIGNMCAKEAADHLTDTQKTILEALMMCGGNALEAARSIGMNRTVMKDQIPLIQGKIGTALGIYKVVDNVQTGNNIRKYRMKTGFTASEMAELLGINRRTYYHWEKGETTVPEHWLRMIADCLGVDPADLVAYL